MSGSEQHTKWTVMTIAGYHPDPPGSSFLAAGVLSAKGW